MMENEILCNFLISTFITFPLCQNAKRFLTRKVRSIFSLFLEDVMTQQYAIDTLLAQAGNRSDERTGAVSAPIFLSTAYGHCGIGESTDLITHVPKKSNSHSIRRNDS